MDFSIVLIGILEVIAEATAGLSEGYFGKLSDNMGTRLPFVLIGYGLSAISKPMMAAFVFPVWIFFARTIDRLGKGIRTGARDALLSDEATPETKARVFGFHRSLDTLGAVASSLAGFLWFKFGASVTFITIVLITVAVIIYIAINKFPRIKQYTNRISALIAQGKSVIELQLIPILNYQKTLEGY